MTDTTPDPERLARRLARERAVRIEAQRVAEEATRELERTREQLRLHAGISAAANAATDLDEALRGAMDAVLDHTGWEFAHAWVQSDDHGTLRTSGVWAGAPVPQVFRRATEQLVLGRDPGLPTRILASGRPEGVADIASVPAFARERAARAAGLRAAFAFPVTTGDGEVAAILEFFTTVPVEPTAEQLETMEHVGAQMRPVIDRVSTQAALRGVLEELERSNAELAAFAYAASHDLREPLRTVGGFAELLSGRYEGRLDGEADQFLSFIRSGVRRMEELVDDLLSLARAGRGAVRRDVIDLGAVVADALQSLAGAVEASRATVTVAELPEVVGDAGQFRHVLENLLGNAIKFSGDRPPNVAVHAERRDDAWCVVVTDEGVGIPPGQRERIFEMFERLHGRGDVPGSGLGLAICRRIVEHHGGSIWAEPGPGGHGSRFCVLLPDRDPAGATPPPAAARRTGPRSRAAGGGADEA